MANSPADLDGRLHLRCILVTLGNSTPEFCPSRIGIPACHACHSSSIGWPPRNRLHRNGYDKTSSRICIPTASLQTSMLPSRGLPPFVQKRMSIVPSLHLSLYPLSDFNVHPAYDDGRTQLLLCIHGVLPITFRNASYNIPMAFWIPRDYPKLPPIAYVVPTIDMLVKPGRYVDVSGRCNPDYVRNWERKHEVSCLLIPGPRPFWIDNLLGLQSRCIVASHARPILSGSPSFL